jgi:hypothetical protein
MERAERMIVFHGCLFDASRIGAEGQIASRLYFEVVSSDAPGGTCRVDVVQPDDVPYGEGEVRIQALDGAGCDLDRAALTRVAAEYYRLVASDFREGSKLARQVGGRARDVIISRTWKSRFEER